MQVRYHLLDPSLTPPVYQTAGAVGFDLAPSEDATLAPGEIKLVPTGLIIEVPAGHVLLVLPRSSLARKKSLLLPNACGVIDQDYHGPEDQIHLQLYNFSQNPVTVLRGERLCQGLIVPVVQATFSPTLDPKAKPSRGGFGTSGGYKQ